MKIKVTTLPVDDIIKDLSESLDAPVKEVDGELKIEVPEKLGEGSIRGASFDSGVGIIYYNCKFSQDVEIHFCLHQLHPLKFIFCPEGELAHRFEDSEEIHQIDTYQNIIVSSSNKNGHVLMFKEGVATQAVSLEIIRNVFSKRSNDNFQGLDPTIQELLKDTVSKKEFYYHGNYSIKAADIISDIDNTNYQGFLKSVYFEGKSLQMLVTQIAEFQGDLEDENNHSALPKKDMEKVKTAVKMITDDLGKNYTVEELAKEVGTNVNKLQDGFKRIFDLTVNKYVQNKKLTAAKNLLMYSDMNISEIVAAIGLNNRSYFSKTFKERYGVSPKHFLQARKNNHNRKGRAGFNSIDGVEQKLHEQHTEEDIE